MYDWNVFGSSIATATSSGAVVKATPDGQGYNVTANTSGGWDLNAKQLIDDGDTPLSIFIVWSQNTYDNLTAGGDVLYAERPNGTQIFKLIINDNRRLSVVMRDGSGGGLILNPTGASVDQTKELHTGAFVQRSGTNRDFYCDGSTANITNSNTGAFSTAATPAVGYDPNDLSVGANESTILAVFTWRRALSALEIRALEANPWQLLQPRTQLIPVGVAAAPSGFQAAWARNSNQIIGISQ